ncbi:MAG: UDP-N-acetylglucosamine 2-epimerase, partial [Acidobacteria bacterium]|nr:UDP-N-acetylglucosamine 2-epimerase [Acidobacteriota bacterium]
QRDGFPIGDTIEMLLSSDSSEGVAKSMGLGIIGFAQSYSRVQPDLLLVLGDRFEMHAAVVAALPFNIPIAHIHGGESTEGLIDEALRHGDRVIVDEFIDGREIEVAILDGPRAALPGEVHSANEWYDYDAKYNDEDSIFEVPARLSQQRTAEVQALAAQAFTAVECRGLARVDFFLEDEGRGFLVNEVNTMPGFTPISGFPKMWMASGVTYAELCNELVELALRD